MKRILDALKICFVTCLAFFGASYTIMTYHNDVGIVGVFQGIYELILGYVPTRPGILEASYSIGLFAGIALYFNHLGGKKITKEPTPLEVEMETYEMEVQDALKHRNEKGRA